MKALGMLSGGLDSRLAIKVIQEQGITIEAMHAKLPFEGCCLPDCTFKFAQAELFKLHILDCTEGRLFQEYMRLIRTPKHGHGSGINPCIDCHAFIFRKAKLVAAKIGAKFIFTGEVLGERPMSQMKRAMELVEKESGLTGKLLRPLSAKLLPETEAEKNGWVDRSRLYSIQGRCRKIQFELAAKFRLKGFPTPAGGCLLCEKEFAKKLRDFFSHNERVTPRDILLLKTGRHFRLGDSKIIVGRNEKENNLLLLAKSPSEIVLEVPGNGSPITLMQGAPDDGAIKAAASLTARYSDAKEEKVSVKYGKKTPTVPIIVKKATEKEIEQLRVK